MNTLKIKFCACTLCYTPTKLVLVTTTQWLRMNSPGMNNSMWINWLLASVMAQHTVAPWLYIFHGWVSTMALVVKVCWTAWWSLRLSVKLLNSVCSLVQVFQMTEGMPSVGIYYPPTLITRVQTVSKVVLEEVSRIHSVSFFSISLKCAFSSYSALAHQGELLHGSLVCLSGVCLQ